MSNIGGILIKKKLLSIILIIAMLSATLIALAGCGNEESNTNKEKKEKTSNKTEYATEENQDASTDVDENNNTSNSTTYKSTGDMQAISRFICPFSSGMAIVDSKGKQYVIDEKGNVLFDFTTQYKQFKDTERSAVSFYGVESQIAIRNGYVFCYNSIYDKTGKQIYQQNGPISDISESGYFAGYKSETEFEGKKTTYMIMNPEGKVIASHIEDDGSHFTFIDEDVYSYTDKEDEYHFIDAKTGKELSDLRGTIVGKTLVGSDIVGGVLQVLNDEYYIGEFGLGGDKEIYKVAEERTSVKEFGESGLKYIVYYNDVYYVYSKTGYLYTMDKSFNYIAEPVKVSINENFYLTTKGVLIEKDDKFIIIDEKLNEKESLPSNVNGKRIASDLICRDVNAGRVSYVTTKFIYFEDGSYYDLDAKYYYEMIKL